ncbi:MAG: hypothetical protein ACJ76A_12030 [Actinomycetota bacterium]
MPKPVKIVIWVAVFAACAGVGAFVASRSNPFPPGVEDPGAHTTPTPTPTEPVPAAWKLTMHVDTQHTLHEGGACRSDWNVSGTIEIQPNGKASGAADATLAAPATCDFAQSQVQAKEIRLVVTGTRAAGVLRLSFSEGGRTPVGSSDLGGLTNTVRFIHPVVKLPAGARAGHATAKVTRPDGDLGFYSSTTLLRIALQ